MGEHLTLTVRETEDKLASALRAARSGNLSAKFCDCGFDTGFLCYPEDGACSCGVYKHHVHGRCGHVTQVG